MQFDFINDTVVSLDNSETVAVGATDAVSGAVAGKGVLVVTTVDTWVAIGAAPSTTTGPKGLVTAGSRQLFAITPGAKVAVKAVGSSAGSATLYVL